MTITTTFLMLMKSEVRGVLTDTTTITITFGMLLIQMMTMMDYPIGLRTMTATITRVSLTTITMA